MLGSRLNRGGLDDVLSDERPIPLEHLMTDHQPTKPVASRAYVEVVVDGVRRPGRLHGIWRRGGQHVCEVSWRPRPGVLRIDTLSAADVWVTPSDARTTRFAKAHLRPRVS
jgi:hypothetical protein